MDRDSKTLGEPRENTHRKVANRDFLSTADLAKTLLLTFKSYGIDLGRYYDVYEYLCKSR
jgi:hypothetical protein